MQIIDLSFGEKIIFDVLPIFVTNRKYMLCHGCDWSKLNGNEVERF